MPLSAKYASVSVLCLGLAAGPATADITGADVWADWKAYIQSFGYEMTADETQTGDQLQLSNVVMSMDIPEGQGAVSMRMGELSFTNNSDGSVTVNLPTDMPVDLDLTPDGGEAVKGRVNFAQTAPQMRVSGEPDDMTYVYSAAEMSITLDSLEIEGQALPPEMMAISAVIRDLQNTTSMQIGDQRIYSQKATYGELDYNVTFDIPQEAGGAGQGSYKGTVKGLAFEADGVLPQDANTAAPSSMIEAGADFDVTMTYDAGSAVFEMDGPDGAVSGDTSSSGGGLEVAIGDAGLSYGVTQNDFAMNLLMADFPLPISVEIAEVLFGVSFPVVAKDAEQDFGFLMSFSDLALSDTIWGLFDPAGQLPRDPANLSLDLEGAVTVLVDFLDPENQDALESGEAPGEINSLTVSEILLSAVGAEVFAEGAFTFDNTDFETFDGLPRAEGSLNIRLTGANALMDTLVAMGFLPEEQAMGARMMMGLFTVPESPDVLTSVIEINKEGHVLANGQRVQ